MVSNKVVKSPTDVLVVPAFTLAPLVLNLTSSLSGKGVVPGVTVRE